MSFLDWFFPKTCVGCGKIGAYFCPSCTKMLTYSGLICPVCEKPQPFGETHPKCKTKHSFSGLAYIFDYERVTKQAIHQLKYRFVSNMADEFVSLITLQIEEEKNRYLAFRKFIVENKPMVVPIPLHWRRQNYRGFNQAEVIARKLAETYSLPFNSSVLTRKILTETQTSLSLEERKTNVKGIFSVLASFVPPSLLLVDDVWTTGATMKEACRVLRGAGAGEVWGITIAR